MEVVLRKLSKRYGRHPAVTDLSLTIHDGEFLVLLGPSGCGKTTTLRMIAGLTPPDAGDLLFEGQRVNDVHPSQRDIAMVFQDYALYPHKTAFENMAFNLRLRGLPRDVIQRKVEATADLLHILSLLPRKPRELSGGERQRVALGRAIVRDPKLFLMDEPLSNLDAKLRERMRVELKALQRRLRVTTVYVTHDQSEAMLLADRVAVMDRGRLQQLATPHEIYRYPRNLFAATFIGSPRMNLVRGVLQRGDAGVRLVAEGLPSGMLWQLHLPAALEPLAPEAGIPVLIGFRPESGRLAPGWRDHDALNLTLDFVEPLGPDNLLVMQPSPSGVDSYDHSPLILRVSEQQRLPADQRLSVNLAPDEVYLFDQHSGEAIFCRGRLMRTFEGLDADNASGQELDNGVHDG